MNTETLSGRQLVCITGLFIIGSSSMIGSSGVAGRDTWIATLLATAAALPLALIYARISSLFGRRNLFEIIFRVFGKRLGWLISLAVTLYCFGLGTLVLRDFPEFVQVVSFPQTPKIVFAALLGLVCAYLAWLGTGSFGKSGILFFFAVGAVAVLTFLLLLPNMELEYLQPVLKTPWNTLGMNAAKLFCSPFGETILLLCLFCDLRPGQSKKRAFVLGVLLGGAYLTLSVLRNILVLGAGNFGSLYYPSYDAVSTINIGDFLQRIEVLSASYMLLCDVVKISAALYAACLGLSSLLRCQSYKSLVLPVALAMIALSPAIFRNTMEFFSWSSLSFAWILPIQLLLPLIILVWGELNNTKLK